jgi:Predicted aminopeptidases
MAGHEGEARGAKRVREAFDSAGLADPRIEEFSIPGWWRERASLTITGAVERAHQGPHEVIALPGSPSGTVEAELIDLGAGGYDAFEDRGDELEGAVVMVSSETPEEADRWVHRMEKYSNAANAGAAALVFRNHIEGGVPPTGEVGYNNRPGPIPAVGVSREVGARLARLAGGRASGLNVRVEAACHNEPATSRNVAARVGPEPGDRPAVLVTAHVDGHDIGDGALDNAAGSAVVAEVGRLLTAVEDRLDHPVQLVTFGSEEIGLRGAYRWVETHDREAIKCVVNVDGAGSSRTLRVNANGFDELERIFQATTDAFDAPLSTNNTISPHGDQWAFVQEGIPAAMTSSTSDSSGRGWGHTHADTLDKLDSRDLRDIATLIAEGVYRLADASVTVSGRSRREIETSVPEGYVTELKTGGRWPY